ncbi:MAG TPA: hypothetical protein VN969_42840 [Streptosporangiaceae bacterium]|nr:hypothetical protein [Streptosporangiaceae bacterium]
MEVATACDALADNYTADMPSAALGDLLQLGRHARKHTIRLSATAASHGTSGEEQSAEEQAAGRDAIAGGSAYQGLPDPVAAVTASAHAALPQQSSQEQASGGPENGRTLRSILGKRSRAEQER